MQSSAGRFFRRNVSSSWNNRSSSNYGKDMKKQNGANGVHDYKMSFAIQHHYRKERNETPRSGSSTIHSMIKFPTNQGIVIMETSREALWECRHLERVQGRGRASINNGIPVQMFPTTGVHTEEGVYCFTHMPRELKNSAATLQRMMEKVLANQRGRNMEIYLEEIVIKSKNEQDLVQGVEEILRKLKRVNINIDPITSLFGVKEGRFLGHMVTKEGVRADPEKVQAIILSPTPKSPNQIRSLFLQLTAISKFIPKLTELKYPIRKVRMRFEISEGYGWTNKAKEALQRIKMKLNKLQTLTIPKEGDVMMLCLRQRSETISSMLLVEREGIQIHVSYVRATRNGDILHPNRKDGTSTNSYNKIPESNL
ncbi:hypothetical protein Tco_0867698 [Tanacetum coccineum]